MYLRDPITFVGESVAINNHRIILLTKLSTREDQKLNVWSPVRDKLSLNLVQ